MKIHIHMKSGKTLIQKGVKDYNIKWNNSQLTCLELKLFWWASRSVIVQSLDMASIEAITKH